MRPFWSTSTDESVVTQYAANVVYYIVPNPARYSWHARPIAPFSVNPSQNEFLYPSGSNFQVVSANCVTSPFNGCVNAVRACARV